MNEQTQMPSPLSGMAHGTNEIIDFDTLPLEAPEKIRARWSVRQELEQRAIEARSRFDMCISQRDQERHRVTGRIALLRAAGRSRVRHARAKAAQISRQLRAQAPTRFQTYDAAARHAAACLAYGIAELSYQMREREDQGPVGDSPLLRGA
jgi:hypothetical protein